MGSRRRNLLVLAIVVALTAASALVIAGKPTVLGLDLSGGTELVYEARPTPQTPEPAAEDIERAIEIIRTRTDKLGVSEPEISRIGLDQIQVDLPNVQNADRAIEQVGTTAQLFLYDFEDVVIPQDPNADDPEERPYNRLYDAVVDAGKRKSSCPEDACTTTGPTHYLFGANTLELLAGPAERESDLYFETDGAKPPDSEVLDVPQGTVVVQKEPDSDNPETEADESEDTTPQYFVLVDRPELTGTDITNPEQQFDPGSSQPNVSFGFTDQGRDAFQEVTKRIAERGLESAPPTICASPGQADQFSDHFAIVLDAKIQSRPIINFCENPEGIDGRTGAQIGGSFSVQEAQDLAQILQIGALPVKLELISQSTVSATLGADALDQGVKAGLAGLILVLLFLIAYYRLLGVVAALGLLVYGIFFYALVELIPITLTLPGIAGLILTIGVAADANVVIFERIKEEARAGKSMASAIATGYRKGIGTIVDANVITLITAFILFVLATAGVKGFAFTLGIGTIVSLFTAVLFTQAILGSFGRARFLRSPAMLGAGERHVSWNFDFTGASRWFFSISGTILALGAIAFATKQLNLGIDFESGTRITASLVEPVPPEDIRAALTDAGVDGAEAAEVTEAESQTSDAFGQNVIQIQAKIPPDQTGNAQTALEKTFGLEGGADGFDSQSIGPTFGEQIARSAVIAILFSLLVISAYVAIRFEAKYAVPVLIALLHDILITAGVYALVGQEVTSGTVAAFLTILGYSMYDTIIVFDRIRENVPRMPRAAFSQIVNRSMSEVLTRSLITGLSTVFLIGVLLAFGGETLRDFAFAMMVGVASGTYSSIFIASPVLTEWKEREPAYRSRRDRILEAMGRVPTFPEDNLVAKIDEVERHVGTGDGDGALAEDGPEPEPEPSEPLVGIEADSGESAPEPVERKQKKRRRQQRKRKHGRRR